jgi:hypothetical protein
MFCILLVTAAGDFPALRSRKFFSILYNPSYHPTNGTEVSLLGDHVAKKEASLKRMLQYGCLDYFSTIWSVIALSLSCCW